jgi:hypothetical protein
MNKSNNILFAALLASTLASSNSVYGWLADFDAVEDFVEQQLEDSLQSIKQMHKQFKHRRPIPHYQTISVDSNDKLVTITVHAIEADNIEANLNNENTQLSITTPHKKITIKTYNNVLAIEAKETIEQKTKDDNQNEIMQFVGTTVSHQESLVAGKPLLEKQTIDYNPDTKDLIITIPFQESNKGKIVTINKLPKKETTTTTSIPVSTEKPTEEIVSK